MKTAISSPLRWAVGLLAALGPAVAFVQRAQDLLEILGKRTGHTF